MNAESKPELPLPSVSSPKRSAPKTPRGWLAVLGLAALALAGFATWRYARSAGVGTEQGPRPGARVDIWLGRAAVMVEGDAADPLETCDIRQDGQTLPLERWELEARWRVLAYLNANGGAPHAKVETRHRREDLTLELERPRTAVPLARIDLKWSEAIPSHGEPDTALAFAPGGRALAIGAASGEFRVVPIGREGIPKYAPVERSIPEGLIKDLAFTPDGAMLVAGEQSPDGFVYGFDAATGKERWKFRLADELGNERSQQRNVTTFYSMPGAYRVVALSGGDVLTLGLHSWVEVVERVETKRSRSRIYRLDAKTGAVKWRWPADKPLERNITWLAADAAGARVACVVSVPSAGSQGADKATLDVVVLEGNTGAETGQLQIPALEKYFDSTSSWQSLTLSRDGSAGILGASDGRIFAFDLDAQGVPTKRWTEELGTPVQSGGTNYHCNIGWAALTTESAVFTVGRNWPKFGTAAPSGYAPDIHPEALSIHAFSMKPGTPKAERLWRYDAPGDPQGLWLSPDGRWLAFAYKKEASTDAAGQPQPPDYGVCMLDLARPGREKLVYKFATEGPLFFRGVFSDDGRYLALAEGPRPGEDKLSATRTYRVLILH